MRISDWSSDVCSSDLRSLTRSPHGVDEFHTDEKREELTMKMFARTVLAGMATLMLATPVQAQITYNIASLADFTGPYADVMKDLNGARHSAVAWWNAEVGKDLGVQPRMKDYDHRYDAAQVASLRTEESR